MSERGGPNRWTSLTQPPSSLSREPISLPSLCCRAAMPLSLACPAADAPLPPHGCATSSSQLPHAAHLPLERCTASVPALMDESEMCGGSARAAQPRRWLRFRSSAFGGAERRSAGPRRTRAPRPPAGATRPSSTILLLILFFIRQVSSCFLSWSPLNFVLVLCCVLCSCFEGYGCCSYCWL
jgi:hypothetical protein